MRKISLCLVSLASLFLLFQKQAVARETPPNPVVNKPSGGPEEPAQSTLPLQPMDVGTPTPPSPPHGSYFYPFEKEISLNFGMVALSDSDGSTSLSGMIGMSYLWQSQTAFHWDSGLEFNTTGDGLLWFAGREVVHFTDRFRPYYSTGVGLRLRSERGLTNLLSIGNYFIRLEGGVEYTVSGPSSIKTGVFGGLDAQGRWLAGGMLGYVYSF